MKSNAAQRRPSLRIVATFAVATITTLAMSSPAHAGEPGDVQLSSYLTGSTVAVGSGGKTVSLRYFATAGSSSQLPATVRATIDTSASRAVQVQLRQPSPGCQASGSVITCSRTTSGGAELFAEALLRLTPAPGAKAGDEGPITVTVSAPGAETWVWTYHLAVAAPGPDLGVTNSSQRVAPGARTSTRPTITNAGTQVAPTILVSLSTGAYTRFPVHYRNCHYKTDDYGFEQGVCVLRDVRLAPGETLIPSTRTPLPTQVRSDVPGQQRISRYNQPSPYDTYFSYGAESYDTTPADDRLSWPAGHGPKLRWDRGHPATLSATAADVDPSDNYGSLFITVSPDNPTDIAAKGSTAIGAVGSVVSADVSIRNNGPAAVSATPASKGGDASDPYNAGLRFTLPANTELVEVILPTNLTYQDVIAQPTPAGQAYLVLGYSLPDGQEYKVQFKLRITSPGTRTGTIVGQGGVNDPNLANNTATVSISSS